MSAIAVSASTSAVVLVGSGAWQGSTDQGSHSKMEESKPGCGWNETRLKESGRRIADIVGWKHANIPCMPLCTRPSFNVPETTLFQIEGVRTRYHEPLHRYPFPAGRMALFRPAEASPEPCFAHIIQRGSSCTISSKATSALLHSHTFCIEMLSGLRLSMGGHYHWPTFLASSGNWGSHTIKGEGTPRTDAHQILEKLKSF